MYSVKLPPVKPPERRKPAIRNCNFAFKCHQQWTELAETTDPTVKFCKECQKEVHFCADMEELAESIALNRCIAIYVDDHFGPRFITGAHKPVDYVPPDTKG